jgi:opacity protein-like surface antigen
MLFFKRFLKINTLVMLLLPVSIFAAPKLVTETYKDAKLMLKQHVQHPFYIGFGIGVGSTDWSEITTEPGAAAQSAPLSAKSNAFTIQTYIGYQFSKHFTVESIYTHYPRTTVGFQTFEQNPGNPNIYGLKSLKTDTDSYSLIGKFLVPFGFSHVNVYADAGVTFVHRRDISFVADPDLGANYTKQNSIRAGASFGFGLATNLSERLFSEASFQYTTGYGKASLKPAESYIPFVYSLTLNLGYRL